MRVRVTLKGEYRNLYKDLETACYQGYDNIIITLIIYRVRLFFLAVYQFSYSISSGLHVMLFLFDFLLFFSFSISSLFFSLTKTHC